MIQNLIELMDKGLDVIDKGIPVFGIFIGWLLGLISQTILHRLTTKRNLKDAKLGKEIELFMEVYESCIDSMKGMMRILTSTAILVQSLKAKEEQLSPVISVETATAKYEEAVANIDDSLDTGKSIQTKMDMLDIVGGSLMFGQLQDLVVEVGTELNDTDNIKKILKAIDDGEQIQNALLVVMRSKYYEIWGEKDPAIKRQQVYEKWMNDSQKTEGVENG